MLHLGDNLPGANSRKRRDSLIEKKGLYLRRVMCLSNNGETVKTVCCTDNQPKPWLIHLSTKKKFHCYEPDCQRVCQSAIIQLRKNKFSKGNTFNNTFVTMKKKIDELSKQNNEINQNEKTKIEKPMLYTTEKNCVHPKEIENNKFRSDTKSGPTATVVVPEIILELIDLCNNIKNSNLLQFVQLTSLCKMKNMYLKDFLNHVNYTSDEIENLFNKNSAIQGANKENYRTTKSDEEMYAENSGIDADLDDEDYEYEEQTSSYPQGYIETSPTVGKERENFNYRTEKNFYDGKLPLISPGFAMDNERDRNLFTTYNCKNPFKNKTKIFENIDFPFKKKMNVSSTLPEMRASFASIKYVNNNETQMKDSKLANNCCCSCNPKSFLKNKEKINKLLSILLTRPRPTFINKSRLVSHVVCKTGARALFPYPPPIQLQLLTPSNRDVSLYTEIVAERPMRKTSSIKSYNPGSSIEDYVAYIEAKCTKMYKVHKKALWDYETDITYNTMQQAITATLEYSNLLREVNRKLTTVIQEPINNEKLLREVKLLYLPGMDTLPETKLNEFERVLFTMETIYSTAEVNKWNSKSEKVSLKPVMKNVMASSVNPDELKYYWIEWRNVTGKRIKSLFEQYVSLMFLAAKNNDFNDASEMWIRQYESEDFLDTLSIHWEEIRPLYTELHAYVRHKLHALYGDVVGIKYGGKIPAHLTGDIWSQNWKHLYNRVEPYHEKDLMNIKLKNKFTTVEITKKVENMFLSMGFTKLPQEFWMKSIFTKPSNTKMSCEPTAWDMGDGLDYRIKLCATPNMQDFYDIHHLVTLIEYYKEYKELPFPFRDGANPSFPEALADAIVLSAHSKSYLTAFGIIKERSEKGDINMLMRMALEKVAFLPYSYILELWRYQVFTGQINATNYNSEWWKLRSQYQGISPPVTRTEDDFDVGSKQHIAANQPYIKYFLSTILEFQFYEVLCKRTNHRGAIHECDLSNSTEAGTILRNVMSLGSSYHWKVAMQVLTGTRKIDSKPLMRYFDPLLQWLKKTNRRENVIIGWEE